MAMDLNRGGSARPVINVTPLVDVVLVLLIIFMVVTPLLEKNLNVQLPAVASADQPETDLEPIVLTVGADGETRINDEPTPLAQIEGKMRELFSHRSDRTIFFRADGDAVYGSCVAAIDAAKAGGAETIGTVLASAQAQ